MNKNTVHIVMGAPDDRALFPEPKKNDVVIGVDSGAMECLKRSIPVTLAIGDFDSIEANEKKELREYAEEIEEFASMKDDTDGELALDRAVKNFNPKKIFIYNWYGGRLDHLFNLLFLVHQRRFKQVADKLVLKNSENTLSFYKPGKYSVNKEDKVYIAFIGMTPIENLTLEDVKYTIANKSYAHPVSLVSNEILNERCHFSFDEGLIAVVQSGEAME